MFIKFVQLFFIIIIFLFFSVSKVFLITDLEIYVEKAINNNLELKKLDFEIHELEMDLKDKFNYLKLSPFKEITQKIEYQKIINRKKDLLFKIKDLVRKNYYSLMFAKKNLEIEKKDLSFEEKYLKEQEDKFENGQISKVQFQVSNERYLIKKANYVKSLMEYKNAKMAFLFELNIDFNHSSNIQIVYKVDPHTAEFHLENDTKRLAQTNRNIQILNQLFKLKEMYYNLLDKKIESKDNIKKAEFELRKSEIDLRNTIRNQERALLASYSKIEKLKFEQDAKNQQKEYVYQIYRDNLKKYQEGKISEYQKNQHFLNKERSNLGYIKSIADLNLEKYRYIDFFN